MTKEKLAAILDGRTYGNEIETEERNLARDNGLVIVYGYSDDNIEFEGAICDEVYIYNGGTVYLDETEVFKNECDDENCPYAARELEKCKSIRAVWSDKSPCWTYETQIPHATFNIYDDGYVYCVGIVFELCDLRK
jgi:hypothetical protein